jgi:hypothetical protein
MSRESSAPSVIPTPAALRAAVARDGRPIYILAAEARIHPAVVGKMLAGHVPITADRAARILRAVRDPDAGA